MPIDVEAIYQRPHDYDLEHEGDERDVAFYSSLAESLRPRRVLELACGSGRVALPLAEVGARCGFDVVGLDCAASMLAEAERKRAEAPPEVRGRLAFVEGDLRSWAADRPFDLIIVPCSSMTHVLTLEDQLATWRRACGNLEPGGRFVVDITMPSLAAYAESMERPARTILEVDSDTLNPVSGERLMRYKATRYRPDEQRASIRFLYDRFSAGQQVDRYVSDFECHVFYPRELHLLFLHTGFCVEHVYGDYERGPLRSTSRQMIFVGRQR